MADTKFTPGPWYVSKRNPLRVIESGPRGNTIAKCGVNLGACGQVDAEANAILIAAAPELLAALQFIVASYGKLQSGAMDEARAAIAKALGEQP